MREGSRRRTKGSAGNSALIQQPTHPQASSTLPAAGTADRGLTSTATQDAVAVQKLWTKPLLDATGIVFRDYALPTNQDCPHLLNLFNPVIPCSISSFLPTNIHFRPPVFNILSNVCGHPSFINHTSTIQSILPCSILPIHQEPLKKLCKSRACKRLFKL